MKSLIKLNITVFITAFLTIAGCQIATAQSRDSLISAEIKNQLINARALDLYYPNSIKRFYEQNGYKLAWVAPDTVKTHAWDAMLLMDCVKHYGLNHADYHPDKLLYETLHKLTGQNSSALEKANFDILLTDAMLCFMNNLHYGKLNPVYTTKKIDLGVKFKAEKVLLIALKNQDFINVIESTQPRSKLYIDLQLHMQQVVGHESGDCYELPEAHIKKMAINMERLRWQSTTGKKVQLTCVMKEGAIVNYKDVNRQDAGLIKRLYK